MDLIATQLITKITNLYDFTIKAKQPESGDLCGNITEFGVAEGDPSTTPNEVILPYRSPDES